MNRHKGIRYNNAETKGTSQKYTYMYLHSKNLDFSLKQAYFLYKVMHEAHFLSTKMDVRISHSNGIRNNITNLKLFKKYR